MENSSVENLISFDYQALQYHLKKTLHNSENHEKRIAALEENSGSDMREQLREMVQEMLKEAQAQVRQDVLNAKYGIEQQLQEMKRKNIEKIAQDAARVANDAKEEVHNFKKVWLADKHRLNRELQDLSDSHLQLTAKFKTSDTRRETQITKVTKVLKKQKEFLKNVSTAG